ncbi:MAG: hypothetical protein SV377_06660, partial [Halobacteria archaeon]|nr:hypothetical protein [Halobacteria archaeon]
ESEIESYTVCDFCGKEMNDDGNEVHVNPSIEHKYPTSSRRQPVEHSFSDPGDVHKVARLESDKRIDLCDYCPENLFDDVG